jgi:putative ABC transport system permease protein
MFFNAFLIAVREIRRNLTRSFLTVLGIIIGVAAVITMVTLGRGATEMIKSQISNLGSNLIIIRAGQGWGPQSAPLFSKVDVDRIKEQIVGIKEAAPLIDAGSLASYLNKARNCSLQGTTTNYFQIANWKINEGRFFDENDVLTGATVCVIGETIRKELFGSASPVGMKIRLRGGAFTVVGVTKVKGQGGWGDDLDDKIIMPYTTLQQRFSGKKSNQNINYIMVSGAEGYSNKSAMADVSNLLRERRNLSDKELNNFDIIDTRQLAEAMSSSTQVMTSLLGAVAGVSLLVGGIGIMNIMLVSVTERTREIGIRLAVGARAREVLLQFLVEAMTLSCVGGVAGIMLAYILCETLAKIVGAPFMFDPKINFIAFIFSATIGIIFGFMPARRAAALDPIDALRHE